MVNMKDIPLVLPQEQMENPATLDYWRGVLRHKWSIAGLAFVTLLLATLIVFQVTPVYRSTSTLLIESTRSKVVSIEEVYNTAGSATREFFQTQLEIIKSREVAKKVIQRLDLAQHPDFDPELHRVPWALSWLPAALAPENKKLSADEALELVIKAFDKNLLVEPVRGSQLVKISFDSHDRELAAKVPDTLAEVYIEHDLEARLQTTRKASAWLTSRIGDLREKLETSERSLQQYRERERIVDVKGAVISGASKQLEETTTTLVAARQRRVEAENAYNQVQAARKTGVGFDSIPAVLKHPLVQRLKEIEAEAERKISEVSKRYGTDHPRLIAAEAELKSARENTKNQIESVISGNSKEFDVARANEAALERNLGQTKAEIQTINRKEFQLGVLQREAAANRQLYELFVNRFKETNIAGDLQNTIARIVDPAVVQNIPYSPKKLPIIASAIFAAVLIGIALAILIEYLDNTIKTSEDVENRLGVPVLGTVQRIKVREKSGIYSQRFFLNDSQSAFAESIRTIRTGVLMSGLDSPHKVIVVSSAVPREGKTTVAMNLAFAIGQMKKTVLIDADMRRPFIGQLLGYEQTAPGLSNLVAGTSKPADCIHPQQDTLLQVIPSGTIPPNPLELLSSLRFEEALEKLKSIFEVIIIDSPPVQLVSDALVLARHAGAVIYVVKADATPYQVSRDGLKRLRQANAPVLGAVLNQLDLKKASRYYGNYYGDYHGYSQTYAYSVKKN